LYQGETIADIDARDINTLTPLDDTFICMRLAVPGDEVATSQYLPEKGTNEYRVPSIHNVRYKPPMDDDDDEEEKIGGYQKPYPAQPRARPHGKKEVDPAKIPKEKDPFYRCAGINVFVHYVKQFPSQGTIKVGATLLEENNVVKIGYNEKE
jgi:hypothetical protein